MQVKVRILFGLCFFFLNQIMLAQDTLLQIHINHEKNTSTNQIDDLSFPFFDIHQEILYSSCSVPDSIQLQASYIQFNLKKKHTQTRLLQPIISHQYLINGQLLYTDSMQLEGIIPSGNYILEVCLIDKKNKKFICANKLFQTVRKQQVTLTISYETQSSDKIFNDASNFVNKYTAEQVIRNIKSLQAIASPAELYAIASFTQGDSLSRMFFYNFWYQRNAIDPEKEWLQYADNLNYVARKYGRTGTPGYATDRGKIFLMFGEPHQIERRDSERGALPYEVWFYYETKGRKNVKFLFYQPGNVAGEMKLLHSTESDFIINPYWRHILLQDPTSGDNPLKYRVFEYFPNN